MTKYQGVRKAIISDTLIYEAGQGYVGHILLVEERNAPPMVVVHGTSDRVIARYNLHKIVGVEH